VIVLDEDMPQEANSEIPAGVIVALTVPLPADPVPTGPSTDLSPPEVSKQDNPKKFAAPVRFAVILAAEAPVTDIASNRA
jgi:hypothetical protein